MSPLERAGLKEAYVAGVEDVVAAVGEDYGFAFLLPKVGGG